MPASKPEYRGVPIPPSIPLDYLRNLGSDLERAITNEGDDLFLCHHWYDYLDRKFGTDSVESTDSAIPGLLRRLGIPTGGAGFSIPEHPGNASICAPDWVKGYYPHLTEIKSSIGNNKRRLALVNNLIKVLEAHAKS